MATVPKHLHLGEEQNRNRLNGVSTDQPLHNATPESKRSQTISTAELRRIRSFTTEDLPSSTKPLLPPRSTGRPTSVSDSIQSELESEKLEEEKESIGGLAESETLALLNHKDFSRRKASQRVAKLGTLIIDKVKKSFTKDESERILRSDWVMIETEEGQLKDFQQSIIKLVKAFKFSKSTTLINLATSTLKRCEILVERCSVHAEKCHMMFSHCSNEMSTLQDYLGKMRCCVIPPPSPVGVTPSSTVQRDKTEELRNARRVEWAVSRMTQILQSILADMTESLDELDEMIRHCTKLMVQVITLLHMRGRSADFSGTGVAAGAASVVAGAVVGAAGMFAAPATGGLSVPISLAGKSLFVSGVAALTPSTIMLKRHNKQMNGLVKLIECLKFRLEIMNQKREELAIAKAACEEAELNIKQAGYFCQDATELEISSYESAWPFIDAVSSKLTIINTFSDIFLANPGKFHYCKSEDSLKQYLIPDGDEEEA